MSKVSEFVKQAVVLCTLMLASAAYAQQRGCNERLDQYESQSRCERFNNRCTYDRRSGCYIAQQQEPPRCNERRNEYDTERECLRTNNYCEFNRQSQCYEPATPERQCNEKYNEYKRESACQSDHSQGCEYRSDIKCYVPKTKPPPPPVCPWNDDDGSYEGRGRRGFRNQEICEISEGRRSGACEHRNDGCWHPRGR